MSSCKIILPDGQEAIFDDVLEMYQPENQKFLEGISESKESFFSFMEMMNDQLQNQEITIEDFDGLAKSHYWKKLDFTDEGKIPRYVHTRTGHVVTGRVTDAGKQKFLKFVGLKEAIELEQSEKSDLDRRIGEAGHNYNAWWVTKHAKDFGLDTLRDHPEEWSKFPQAGKGVKKELEAGLKYLLQTIANTQKKIDPDSRASILTEQRLYDKFTDTAGTADLIVRYSDGSVSIYDYKFINLLYKNKDGHTQISDISASKRSSYDAQMSTYKKMMEDYLGVSNFRETRIIPIAKMQMSKATDERIGKLIMFKGPESNAEVRPLPLANEQVQKEFMESGEKISKFVEKLRARLEGLKKKKNPSPSIIAQIQELQKAIDELILFGENKDLQETATILLEYVHDNLDDFTIEDLNISILSAETYGELLRSQASVYRDNEEAYENIANLTTQLDIIREQLYDKLQQQISTVAMEVGLPGNLTNVQRDLGGLSSWFKNISDVPNEAFQTFYRLYLKGVGETKTKIDKLERELEKLTRDLSVEEIESIIDPNTGNLMTELDSLAFHKDKKEAQINSNYKWLFNNVRFDREAYNESLKLKKEALQKAYPGKGNTNKRKAELKKWIEKHDLKVTVLGEPVYKSAWENTKNRFMVPKEGVYLNPNFDKIKSNEKLYAFHQFYVNHMGTLVKDLRKHMDTGRMFENFLPNVRRELIESGFSMKGMGERFMDMVSTRNTDETVGVIDRDTGVAEAEVPIFYTDNYKFKNFENVKSKDVARSLYLFSNSAYQYLFKKEIEPTIQALATLIQNQDVYKTDTKGVAKKTESGELELLPESKKKNVEIFEQYVARLIYGQYIQNQDTTLSIGDKEFSSNKIIQSLLTVSSGAVLGLQPMIAAVAATSASLNRMFMGAEGIYFNNSQYRQMLVKQTSADKKYWALSRFWDVNKDETWRANRISSRGKLSNWLTYERLFDLLRIPDEAVRRNTTMTMMMNYGIDPESGKIKRLSYLEEGSKSLWERMDYSEDGTVVTIDGIDINSKESPVSQLELQRFREMGLKVSAKATGQASEHDQMLYKTHILGRLASQYRTWIPMMIQSRFGSVKYDYTTEEFESGRMKVFAGELLKNPINTVKEMMKEIALIFHSPNTSVGDAATEFYFNKYINENPDFANKVKELGREEAFQQYRQMRIAKFHGALVEIRGIAWAFGVISLLGSLLASGDDPRANAVYSRLNNITSKILRDLSFFYNPSSFTDLFTNTIPIVSFIANGGKAFTNALDELLEALDVIEEDENTWGTYTRRVLPLGWVFDWFEDVDTDD